MTGRRSRLRGPVEQALLQAMAAHPDPAIRETGARLARLYNWTVEDVRDMALTMRAERATKTVKP